MPSLTQAQLDQLKNLQNVSFEDFRQAYLSNPSTSYAAQYYGALESAGFDYGGLALGGIRPSRFSYLRLAIDPWG